MSKLFNHKIFTLAQKSLNFRIKRHDLLTSNVANKDTPHYQAEDLVFESQLKKALHADEPGSMRRTDRMHFDGRQITPLQKVKAQRILSSAPFPGFDGNTVDLDREMAKMAENQLMYNATLRMLTHKFRGLKAAISEGTV